MTRDRLFAGLGAALLLLGLVLRDGWFVPLPQRDVLPPPPVSGVLLLRLSLIVEGLVLLGLGRARLRLASPVDGAHPLPGLVEEDEDTPRRRLTHRWLLAGVTALALGLRAISLNADLWLDELTPMLDYGHASIWQVAISYISSNSHLLNAILVKLCVAAFGQQEWAIRLPAVLFGVATVPVLYWVARLAAPRHVSLGAALLLATSYHHIFFSQNARGYSGYLFFSLLATGCLVRGLRHDRTAVWAGYVAAAVLDVATILLSAFVLASHALVAMAAVLRVRSGGGAWRSLVMRVTTVFAVVGVLGFQVYALVLPHMYVYMQVVYADPATGFSPFSRELLIELGRGLSSGFATGLLFGAVPFLGIAGAGFAVVCRRNWVLAAALTLPGVLQALVLVVRGLTFSPRFFLLALPLAMLVAACGIEWAVWLVARTRRWDARRARLWTGASIALVALVSLAALPRYYAVPKQAYRSAIEYVESVRRPDGVVIVVHLAQSGVRYYGPRYGLRMNRDYFEVRTMEALDQALARTPGRPSWLIITLPRALRLGLPDLDARLRRDWVIDRTFPGTIGDGDITIWRQRPR